MIAGNIQKIAVAYGGAEFVAAIQDPNHPDHEDMLEWVDRHFDPNEFDLDEVNEQLSAIR